MNTNSPKIDNACIAVRAVLVAYPEIAASSVDDICSIIRGQKIATDSRQPDSNEPPVSAADAAKMLGISKAAVHYHARMGRIRRVKIGNAKRGRGFVAADIWNILNGR